MRRTNHWNIYIVNVSFCPGPQHEQEYRKILDLEGFLVGYLRTTNVLPICLMHILTSCLFLEHLVTLSHAEVIINE
jgi:hypothetical protein